MKTCFHYYDYVPDPDPLNDDAPVYKCRHCGKWDTGLGARLGHPKETNSSTDSINHNQ